MFERDTDGVPLDLNNKSVIKQFMSVFGGAILISMAC
jgi:NRAMP (natural resistance-associated macrophage protein)-like metal ion transporter